MTTTSSTVVVGGGKPADLIAYAWFGIGYRPTESLVLVGLSGPRQRTGMVLRIDLPSAGDERAHLAQLARTLSEHDQDGVVALIVSDQPRVSPQPHRADGLLPHRRLARRIRSVVEAQGVLVTEVLHVGQEWFRSYLCRDVECCPPDGSSMVEVERSRVAAHSVLQGRVVADDEAQLVADVTPVDPHPGLGPDPLPEDGTHGGDGLDGDGVDGDGVDGDGLDGDECRQRRLEALLVWRTLFAAGVQKGWEPEGDDAARLVDALDDVAVRDAVLVDLSQACDVLHEAEQRWPNLDADPYELVLARQLSAEALLDSRFVRTWSALDGARPDDALVAGATRVLAAAARIAPKGRRAPVLAVLAWIAWWAGDGARARLLAALALGDVPGHRLAALVDALLARAVPPAWVRVARQDLIGPGLRRALALALADGEYDDGEDDDEDGWYVGDDEDNGDDYAEW